MRRILITLALAVALADGSCPAEVIERVVVVVNGHAILLSEWDTAVRLEALLDHKSLQSATDTSRRATLERMIDQELLQGEMENSSVNRVSPEAIGAKVQEIRQQYPEASTDAQWATVLARYGVGEPEVEAAIASDLDGLRLLDFRLRSSAQPDASQIMHYYQTVYEPAMHAKRARPAPLAEVTPQIREILTQQKLTDLTTSWLQTLRSQANIQMNITQPEAPAKP